MPYDILKAMWKKSRKRSVMLADKSIGYEITFFSNRVCPVGLYKHTTVLGNWDWEVSAVKRLCYGWVGVVLSTILFAIIYSDLL